jgi:hypothetical protein
MENEKIWKIWRKRETNVPKDGIKPIDDGRMPSKKMVLAAGLLYLGVILFGMFAQMIRMELIVSGDSAGTVDKIFASNGMLQLAFASDVLTYTCFILLGLTCYIIFKTINNKIAVMMLLFVLISGSFAFVNMLNVLDVIQIVSGAVPLTGAETDMVLTLLNAHEDGGYLAQIIGYGPWLIPLGYLGYRSDFVPKVIGVILMVGGAGLTAQGIQYFLWPSMGDLFVPGIVLSIIGEFAVCGWFLYRGSKGFDGKTEKGTLIDTNDSNAPL